MINRRPHGRHAPQASCCGTGKRLASNPSLPLLLKLPGAVAMGLGLHMLIKVFAIVGLVHHELL